MGGKPAEAAIPGLAANMKWLQDNVPDRNGGRRSWVQVAEEMTDLGYPVTFATVTKIASGDTTSPSARTLYFIARVFDVPTDFFLDEQVNQRIRTQILGL